MSVPVVEQFVYEVGTYFTFHASKELGAKQQNCKNFGPYKWKNKFFGPKADR